MDAVQFNVPAVIVAALSSFLIGGLWYSPILFAKSWMAEAGLSEAQARQGSPARSSACRPWLRW